VRALAVAIGILAVVMSAAGVFFRLFMLPMVVLMGCLPVMMSCGFVVCCGLVVMLARRVFLLVCHVKTSVCNA
jgi:hypothetical protein